MLLGRDDLHLAEKFSILIGVYNVKRLDANVNAKLKLQKTQKYKPMGPNRLNKISISA